jgi:Mce-associated membrane protein
MRPRELPAETLDADNRGMQDLPGPASTSITDADELAQAEARAEAARARALRLRQLAEAADAEATDDEDDAHGSPAGESTPSGPSRKLRRPGRKAMAILAAVGCICGSLTGSGLLLRHHRDVMQQRQRTSEFATAAREAIQTMLSINATTARADVQRFVDDTTGEFKVGILLSAEDFVKAAEQSNTNTKGTVQAVAVQSIAGDSAIVLVAAKSEVTRPGAAKPESRSMRIVVDLRRDGAQLKVSRVEFVQ